MKALTGSFSFGVFAFILGTSAQIADGYGPQAQSITFVPPVSATLGASTALNATATSGLAVTFVSITPTVCMAEGTTAVPLNEGTCSITASEAGNTQWSAAVPVTRSFRVKSRPAGRFVPGSTLTAGVQSSGATVTADFNRDGNQDVAIPIANGGVDVYLGNGDGSFTFGGYISAVGTGTIATGDFNGDGNPDLIVALSSGSASVYFGDDTGVFTLATNFNVVPAGAEITSVTVGDFNGDGLQDVAFGSVNGQTGSVTVFLGTGTGHLVAVPGSPLNVAGDVFWMGTGDFNGDGNQDLALISAGSTTQLLVYLGDGTGNFVAASGSPFSFPAYQAVLADFNGDGYTDIALAPSGGAGTILLGSASGSFLSLTGPFGNLNGTFESMTTGDFNGDGNPDIAVGTTANGSLTFLLGNGSGAFASSQFPVSLNGTHLLKMTAGDFNGDGLTDLFVYDPHNYSFITELGAVTPTRMALTNTLTATLMPGQTFQLTATVTDTGFSFNGPTGTVSLSIDNGAPAALSLTNGIAIATIGAGIAGGSHVATVTYAGDGPNGPSSSSFLFASAPGNATITFPAIANVVLGAAPFTVTATSSAGLMISFVSASTWVCTVSGATVTLVATGTCTILASTAATAGYTAAAASASFQVLPAAPVWGLLQAGLINTVAGTGINSYNGDGIAAASAALDYPHGVAVDAVGNVFIADTVNNLIRRVDRFSSLITTVAGNGNGGFTGDGGPATSATLNSPYGVAVDAAGNLYIADTANGRIRKVDAVTGNISTVAGSLAPGGRLDSSDAPLRVP